MGPRLLGACSLAASLAEVDEAGYSPGNNQHRVSNARFAKVTANPKPNNPSSDCHHPEHPDQESVRAHEPQIRPHPFIVNPFEAVANIPPKTIIKVVIIIANFLPK
jgi:hypothetical protein